MYAATAPQYRSAYGRPASASGYAGRSDHQRPLHGGPRAAPPRGGPSWRPYGGDAGGLRRQASAPTLAPTPVHGHGLGPEPRYLAPSQASSNQSTPQLRRAASAAALGPRPGSAGPARPGRPSPAQKRHPHADLNVSAHSVGSRLHGSSFEASKPKRMDARQLESSMHGSSFQAPLRAGARQLESRLAERLHDLHRSFEAGSRPAAAGVHGRGRGPPAGHPRPRLGVSDSYALPPRPPPDPWGSSPHASRGAPWQGHGRHAAPPRARAPMYDSYADHSTGPGLDHSTGPGSRLRVYSDLFEEVIERDGVFGDLLRKIKTAYEGALGEDPMQPGVDMQGSPDWGPDHLGVDSYEGPHSSEPTTRAEDRLAAKEMVRENRVLRDLVERLHLELEEAVKREHRWRQKVAQLKTQQLDHRHGQQPPRDAGAGQAAAPPKRAPGGSKKHLAARPETHAAGAEEDEDYYGHHAAAVLNQGGILSMSSISPQHSMPPHLESMLGASGIESARSADSVQLPQRPDRRPVVRPTHVPGLDLARLWEGEEEEDDVLDEEEQELQGEEDDELASGEEGAAYAHHGQQQEGAAYDHGRQWEEDDRRAQDCEETDEDFGLDDPRYAHHGQQHMHTLDPRDPRDHQDLEQSSDMRSDSEQER